MLHTLRQLLERTSAAGDLAYIRHRHLEWLITLAERLGANPFDRAATGLLARERANIDAALTWALEAERADDGLRLCSSCGPYWFQSGRYQDAESWPPSCAQQ
jgi:predicted ATPase